MRKKIRINDPIRRPYETLRNKYATENDCLDAIFQSRAKKESGCIYCKCNILDYYQKIPGRMEYQCKLCYTRVFPLAGTILQHTHLDLRDWFYVAIDKVLHNSGITANKVSYQYSLGNKTAWKLLDNIKTWMGMAVGDEPLEGYIECDEVAVTTGPKGLGKDYKNKRGFGSNSITPFLSMVQRDGNVKSFKIPNREEDSIIPLIVDNVAIDSIISTDEFSTYKKLRSLGYKHITVNHSKKEYKKGDASTNRVEGFFGHLKPGIRGTYRHISEKYSQNYMNEYTFRYKFRHLPLDQKFDKLLDALPPLFEHLRKKGKIIQPFKFKNI